MHFSFTVLLVPVGLIALLWCSSAAGAAFARRIKVKVTDLPSIGVIQGALLGLLALLLGFSFSGALTRFSARQDLIVAEANAVGTAWLRADILPQPHRDAMRQALHSYTDARLELFASSDASRRDALIEGVNRAHARAWAVAVEVVAARPELTVPTLPPLNEVADLLGAQNAARQRHIPNLIMAVLLACACGSVASVGFGLVFIDRRTHLPAIVLVLLIAASLWLIIDMDYPRLGLIRIDGQPLIDLKQSLGPAPAVKP